MEAQRQTRGNGAATTQERDDMRALVSEMLDEHDTRRRDPLDVIAHLPALSEMAKKVAPTGLLPSWIKTEGQALAIMAKGAELGVPPMAALAGLHMVEGKVFVSAELMLAVAIGRGVRAQWVHTDGARARVRLSRRGFEPFEMEWTIAQAKAAGLAGKQNWTKYPDAMLRARCLSAALRAFCPDVTAGVYSDDERDEIAPAPATARSLDDVVGAARAEAKAREQTMASECDRIVESLGAVADADGLEAARAAAQSAKPRLSREEKVRVKSALDAAVARVKQASETRVEHDPETGEVDEQHEREPGTDEEG